MSAIPNHRRRRSGWSVLATLVAGSLVVAGLPLAAQEAAVGTLSGLVLDPAGKPAKNFKLVFRDDAGAEHVCEPSDGLGRYSITLPAGTSYQLVAALSPKGERLDVPELPTLPLDENGRRLDIRISSPAPPGGGSASDVPWTQIGIAAGATLVLVFGVLDSGSDEKPASPFAPGS